DAAAALQGAGADRGVRGFGYATAGCRQIDRRAVQRSRVDGDAARAGCKCQGAGRTDEAVGGDGAAAAGKQGDVGGGNRAVDREVAGIGQVEVSGRNDEAGQFGDGVGGARQADGTGGSARAPQRAGDEPGARCLADSAALQIDNRAGVADDGIAVQRDAVGGTVEGDGTAGGDRAADEGDAAAHRAGWAGRVGAGRAGDHGERAAGGTGRQHAADGDPAVADVADGDVGGADRAGDHEIAGIDKCKVAAAELELPQRGDRIGGA